MARSPSVLRVRGIKFCLYYRDYSIEGVFEPDWGFIPVYKGAYLAYTSIVSRSMLLPAEEKNGCKRGASCMNLNMKKLLKLKLRSQTSIHKRRAAEP